MKPVYYHYLMWEEYQAGMYNEEKEGRTERVEKARELLTNVELCRHYMRHVSEDWKCACEHTFTNNYNPKAFLGQCACCMYAGVHEDETREAWKYLSNEERRTANGIANDIYNRWLYRYEREKKMKVEKFSYDDKKLIAAIGHLLGSTDWIAEHDYPLIRHKTKTFYVLFTDHGNFVSMFSENKGVIGDCHTEPGYRNCGYMQTLLKESTGNRAVTRNSVMMHIFEKMGFKAVGTRGRFTTLKRGTDEK